MVYAIRQELRAARLAMHMSIEALADAMEVKPWRAIQYERSPMATVPQAYLDGVRALLLEYQTRPK